MTDKINLRQLLAIASTCFARMICTVLDLTDAFYRLTGDVSWPVFTPFEEAVGTYSRPIIVIRTSCIVGPLAGDFPILSLRTNKADVVVGVPQDVADKLDAAGEKWRVNGKYALVSFVPRRG